MFSVKFFASEVIHFIYCCLFLISDLFPHEYQNVSNLTFDIIDVLEHFKTNSTPQFIIVSTNTYINAITGNHSSSLKTKLLPPNFILSFSYHPLDNTVLDLMSTGHRRLSPSDLDRIAEPDSSPEDTGDDLKGLEESSDKFASVMLLKSTLYLQPEQKKYYPLWTNVSSGNLHSLVFIVNQGVISSCMDGYYLEENPKITLWNTSVNVGLHPVQLGLSKHLHSIKSQVKGC